MHYIINETSDAMVVVDKRPAPEADVTGTIAQNGALPLKVDICDRTGTGALFTDEHPSQPVSCIGSRSPSGDSGSDETNIVGTYIAEAARATN